MVGTGNPAARQMTTDAAALGEPLVQHGPDACEPAGFLALETPYQRSGRERIESLHRLGIALKRVQEDDLLSSEEKAVVRVFSESLRQARVEAGKPDLGNLSDLVGSAVDREREASRFRAGGDFALDLPSEPRAVWGTGETVVWASGEPLLIGGPVGIGKSTMTLRLVLAHCGVTDGGFLGLDVVAAERPVLYVAADRPRQIARNLHRMVSAADRALLNERLRVWPGLLPFDIGREPPALAEWAKDQGAGTVVIDSLKDVAVDLASDETGSRVAQAMQAVMDSGIELVINHHQRKASRDGKRSGHLDEVYGSTWITAKVGSVVLLSGRPGSSTMELTHLKIPAGEFGPLRLVKGSDGSVTVYTAMDPLNLLEQLGGSAEVRRIAESLFGPEPASNEIERARRQMEKLAKEGRVTRSATQQGGSGGSRPVVYRLA